MLLDHLPKVGGGKRGQTILCWQAAGRGVRFEVLTLAARRGGGRWVMPTPQAHGTGTGTNQPEAPRLLPASWLDVQWPRMHLPGGELLTFSSVSSEDSLSKGKVKPAGCTLSRLNSKGRALLPSSTPVCTEDQLPGSWGRAQTPVSTGVFSCLFGCDCPHMT